MSPASQAARASRLGELSRAAAIRAYARPRIRSGVRRFAPVRRPEKWVFLLGCYESGLAELCELLGGHPDIRTLPVEGVALTGELPTPEQLGWSRLWLGCRDAMRLPPGPEPERAARIVHDWSPWWQRGGRCFVDASVASLLRMRWLDVHFPGAHFIGITRDGFSVAEEIRRRGRPRGEAARRVGSRYSIELAGEQWLDANRRLLEGSAQLRRYHQTSYEALAADPVRELGAIHQFLALPLVCVRRLWDDVAVGIQRVRIRDENAAARGRLGEADRRRLAERLGAMQHRLGYASEI